MAGVETESTAERDRWQGKQYESRDALFAALDKAGIHAKKVTRRLHTVYNPQPHTFYE